MSFDLPRYGADISVELLDPKTWEPSYIFISPLEQPDSLLNIVREHESFEERIKLSDEEIKIGVIVLRGMIELYDIRGTDVGARARHFDGIAVMFTRNADLPPLVRYGKRKTLVEAWNGVASFWQHDELVKRMIGGFEQQLLRRVIAVGMELPYQRVDDLDIKSVTMRPGGFSVEGNAHKSYDGHRLSWMSVPATPEERFHGKDLSDDELLELVNFLWAFNPLSPVRDLRWKENPIRRSAAELAQMITRSGTYVAQVDRVLAAVRQSDHLVQIGKRTRHQFDKAVIGKIIKEYQGEDPPQAKTPESKSADSQEVT